MLAYRLVLALIRLHTTRAVLVRCVILAVVDTILSAKRSDNYKLLDEESSHVGQLVNGFIYISSCYSTICQLGLVLSLFMLPVKWLAALFTFLPCSSIIYASFKFNSLLAEDTSLVWRYVNVFLICCGQIIFAKAYVITRNWMYFELYGPRLLEAIGDSYWPMGVLYVLTPLCHGFGPAPIAKNWLPYLPLFLNCLEVLYAAVSWLPHAAAALANEWLDCKIKKVCYSNWITAQLGKMLPFYWICRILIDLAILIIQNDKGDPDIEYSGPSPTNLECGLENNTRWAGFSTWYDPVIAKPANSENEMNVIQKALRHRIGGPLGLMYMFLFLTTLIQGIEYIAAEIMGSKYKRLSEIGKNMFFQIAIMYQVFDLDPDKRFVDAWTYACVTVVGSVLRLHVMIHYVLMDMTASTLPGTKHVKLISISVLHMCLCVFVLKNVSIFPPYHYYTTALYLASILALIQISCSLILYSLIMVDSSREVFWDRLDDYMFYVSSAKNTFGYIFGAWLTIYGIQRADGSAFNLCMAWALWRTTTSWKPAQEEWKAFMERRKHIRLMAPLPTATPREIECYRDVCAICRWDMTAAKVLRCRHMFHGICLRKWLYRQISCPVCKTAIFDR